MGIHILRKKHQEAMMELQEQIDIQSKSKEKVTKENSNMKVEISSLMAQIEVLSQEKISIRKVVEKLEINITDYSAKIEELNKTVIQVSSDKHRLQQDAADANRKFNEMKLAIETSGLDKNKLAGQIKDLQSGLDQMARAKGTAENTIANLQQQIKIMTAEFEELRVIKIDLERALKKATDDGTEWKKKYENEARLHQENMEAIKKTTAKQILGFEDTINQLNIKIKALDQQKNKLQQECSIVIKDLTAKIQTTERRCEETAIKLREMTNMFEK